MQFNAVLETNTPALKLWTSEGFPVIGRTPRGYRHARPGVVDFLILHRALPNHPSYLFEALDG